MSSHYLASSSCQEEEHAAFELHRRKGVTVVPVILSECGWKDDSEISDNHALVLPKDGTPVAEFSNKDAAWQDVYDRLKPLLEKENRIRQIEVNRQFRDDLQDVQILGAAHPQKEKLVLDDIYIPPDLLKHNGQRDPQETVNLNSLLKDITLYRRMVIVGDSQSGKTTVCKKIFERLREIHYIPVYVPAAETRLKGTMDNIVRKYLKLQYDGLDDMADALEECKNRIVPIIDDFYLVNDKKRRIHDLDIYPLAIIVVDDIFALNVDEQELVRSFSHFRIKELKSSLRADLITKWLSVNSGDSIDKDYGLLDKTRQQIESTLGKTIGRGIMPAYPLFVLSIAVAYQTSMQSIDQSISSQGYCYQVFISAYLLKQKVKTDEIDAYFNVLTEFAYYLRRSRNHDIPIDERDEFLETYLQKFTLPVSLEALWKNLDPIVSMNSLGCFSFRYPYIYYFFVARYFAEHLSAPDSSKSEVKTILENLHVEENAYIAIFLAHHSKDPFILDTLREISSHLFGGFGNATLTKENVQFLDEQANTIVEASLPPADSTPATARKEQLQREDKTEESAQRGSNVDDSGDQLEKDLRRSIKTVEVIGSIMRNRAGSLPKTELAAMYKDAVSVHLRILSSFFDLIKKKENQQEMIEYLSRRLEEFSKRSTQQDNVSRETAIDKDKLTRAASMIFWNLNFFTVWGYIEKAIWSTGSSSLLTISDQVCDEMNTPVAFLIKQGNRMWYGKSLQVDDMVAEEREPTFSIVADRVMKMMVAEHCYYHLISYQDRQKIETQLKLHANHKDPIS